MTTLLCDILHTRVTAIQDLFRGCFSWRGLAALYLLVSEPGTWCTMRMMVTLSLSLNIAVLLPVCLGLIKGASWIIPAYGEATAARQILLSVYASILLVSALLLVFYDLKLVAALLLVQVVYKVITPFAVGTLSNPVVVSNLSIAAFHMATLLTIWRHLRGMS